MPVNFLFSDTTPGRWLMREDARAVLRFHRTPLGFTISILATSEAAPAVAVSIRQTSKAKKNQPPEAVTTAIKQVNAEYKLE